MVLPAKAESCDERPVPLDIVLLDIVEEAAAATDEHQEAPATVMVFLVGLEVLREMVDAPGKERDLHLRRPRVGVVEAVLADRCGLVRHVAL